MYTLLLRTECPQMKLPLFALLSSTPHRLADSTQPPTTNVTHSRLPGPATSFSLLTWLDFEPSYRLPLTTSSARLQRALQFPSSTQPLMRVLSGSSLHQPVYTLVLGPLGHLHFNTLHILYLLLPLYSPSAACWRLRLRLTATAFIKLIINIPTSSSLLVIRIVRSIYRYLGLNVILA
jgi:hypothetical protein